jgi:hypothetical protein
MISLQDQLHEPGDLSRVVWPLRYCRCITDHRPVLTAPGFIGRDTVERAGD